MMKVFVDSIPALVTGVGTVANVVIAIVAIWSLQDNHKQDRETQKQALESQQDTHRPLLIPTTKLALIDQGLPAAHPDWSATNNSQTLKIRNVGAGVATSIDCCLLGRSGPANIGRFIFDADQPLPQGDEIEPTQRSRGPIRPDSTIAGYDIAAPQDKVARLFLTYQDIFGKKHASILDCTDTGQWVQVAFRKGIDQTLSDIGMT